jgi:hypothetical protein
VQGCGFMGAGSGSRVYRGTSLIRKCTRPGPYRRPMSRVLGGVLGGWAFSYWRSTPVTGVSGAGRGSNLDINVNGASLIPRLEKRCAGAHHSAA